MSRSLPILVYHSVADDVSDGMRKYAVSPVRFAEHVALLHELDYASLTLSQAASCLLAGTAFPERTVVLTFDDAFTDFVESAFPVLQAANFTATLFVPSAYIGMTSRWLVREGEADRPVMGWDDIRAVAAAGIEIGAHSHTHPQLDMLGDQRLYDEMATPKAVLEDGIGQEVQAVAYPFGFHSGRVRRAARAAGYAFGCTSGSLPAHSKANRWAIPRQTVQGTATVATVRKLIAEESNGLDRTVSEAKRLIWRARRRIPERQAPA
jgi:peptidoglycan/xylan/chitin deacetylase (PgdA/CDA1 family)